MLNCNSANTLHLNKKVSSLSEESQRQMKNNSDKTEGHKFSFMRIQIHFIPFVPRFGF